MGHIIKVAGIDPSFRNTGVAKATIDIDSLEIQVQGLVLIETERASKKLKVRVSSDDLRRAKHISINLNTAVAEVNMAMVEVPAGSQSAVASKGAGISIGVIGSLRMPIIEMTPNDIKIASIGTKTATKRQIIEWAAALYPDAGWFTMKRKGEIVYIEKNEHMADAVAAIHAGIQTDEFQNAISMFRSVAA